MVATIIICLIARYALYLFDKQKDDIVQGNHFEEFQKQILFAIIANCLLIYRPILSYDFSRFANCLLIYKPILSYDFSRFAVKEIGSGRKKISSKEMGEIGFPYYNLVTSQESKS